MGGEAPGDDDGGGGQAGRSMIGVCERGAGFQRRSVFRGLQLLTELGQVLSELDGIVGGEPESEAHGLVRGDAVVDLDADMHRPVGGRELAQPHLLDGRDGFRSIAHRTGHARSIGAGSPSLRTGRVIVSNLRGGD